MSTGHWTGTASLRRSFEGYAEGMAWKRGVHAQYGTTLVESTWADVMFGDGLTKLKDELTRPGLTFDWNPDRPVNDGRAKPMKHGDLARLVRTFMTHVKSNSWTADDLERRLAADLARLDGFRTRLFLEVYWQIHAEWEQRLAADRSVDFEDMLVQAAGHLEAGNIGADYDLIMVDEFQDASRARARLVRGLVQTPGRFLMAVGDDWQSINRFAGADLSVMTDFEAWFGRGHQLALTTTFRCTADDLRCRPDLRVEEPGPVQQADAIRAPRSRPARHGHSGRRPRRRAGLLPRRSVRRCRRRQRPGRPRRHGQRRRSRALQV